MARNGSGTYDLPAGQPVVTGTTISSTTFNVLTTDLANALTGSVSADGQTPITGPLRATNGTSGACSYSWTASAGTGLYSPATDQAAMAAGGTQVMKWAAGATVNVGTLDLNGTTSALLLNTSAGTTGQVLTSAGAGATPTWTTAAGVSLSGTNTWTGAQTFTNSLMKLLGSSTGVTTFTSANAGASDYTITIPAMTATLATLGANTFTGQQTLAENAAIELDATLSADGKYTGIIQAGTASAALAFGELCYKVTATGKWNKASGAAANVGTVGATGQLGICVLAAAGDASATTMLLYGNVRADALFDTFTVGAPVYMSAATAGKIVSAAPSGTTDFTVRKVGFAEDANTVFFCPSNDFITLA